MKKETVLRIRGMNCLGCVRRIDAALRRVDGVLSIEADLSERQVRVAYAGNDDLSDELIEAVIGVGFEAQRAVA